MAMLPKTLTAADTVLYTALISYVYALVLPRGPTYPLLGYTPSILINTSSDKDTHDA